MNGTLNKILIFAAGAAIGSAVSWKYFKTKYERLAEEEIASVKERFTIKKYEGPNQGSNEEPVEDQTETEKQEYEATLKEEGYIDYSDMATVKKKEVTDDMEPYVITPEEFGELDEHETVTVYYYADGVVTDIQNNPVNDLENTIGLDSLSHFGEYEADSVFVRNERLKKDYEILLLTKRYTDISVSQP